MLALVLAAHGADDVAIVNDISVWVLIQNNRSITLLFGNQISSLFYLLMIAPHGATFSLAASDIFCIPLTTIRYGQ